jgi:hypothetical protein
MGGSPGSLYLGLIGLASMREGMRIVPSPSPKVTRPRGEEEVKKRMMIKVSETRRARIWNEIKDTRQISSGPSGSCPYSTLLSHLITTLFHF